MNSSKTKSAKLAKALTEAKACGTLDDSLTFAYKAGYRDAIGSSEFCKRFLEIMKGCAYYPDTSSERSALAKLAQDLESL